MDRPSPGRRRLLFRDADGGASIIEYAILLFLIGMVASVAIGVLGGQVSDSFGEVSTVLDVGVQADSGDSGGDTGQDQDDDDDNNNDNDDDDDD